MVELNQVEKRVIVLVLAAFLAVVFVRWRQVESTRVNLTVESEGAGNVQR
jgi:hypothetical protein